MGVVGFGSVPFSPEIYRKYVEFGAKQSLAFAQAEPYATEALPGLEFATFPESRTIQKFRQTANASMNGGDLTAVSGPVWFAASTAWIERLRMVAKHQNFAHLFPTGLGAQSQ